MQPPPVTHPVSGHVRAASHFSLSVKIEMYTTVPSTRFQTSLCVHVQPLSRDLTRYDKKVDVHMLWNPRVTGDLAAPLQALHNYIKLVCWMTDWGVLRTSCLGQPTSPHPTDLLPSAHLISDPVIYCVRECEHWVGVHFLLPFVD